MLNIVIVRPRRLISRDANVIIGVLVGQTQLRFRHVVVTRALGPRTVWVGA